MTLSNSGAISPRISRLAGEDIRSGEGIGISAYRSFIVSGFRQGKCMARKAIGKRGSLDDRFRFADDSFSSGVGIWQSQYRVAIGVEDGEGYLLRLFKKTGTPLDDDLRRLIARG